MKLFFIINTTQKAKNWATWNPLTNEDELKFSGMVSSFLSASDTRFSYPSNSELCKFAYVNNNTVAFFSGHSNIFLNQSVIVSIAKISTSFLFIFIINNIHLLCDYFILYSNLYLILKPVIMKCIEAHNM